MFHHGVDYDKVALGATEQYSTVRVAIALGSLTRLCQT